jgi:putative two-component system response regulator
MNVLIADDNPNDRYILRLILKAHGCDVREAENGALALAEALAAPPDLIISDALMPDMDGFQFLRAAKADEVLREVPFIFYSAVYTGNDEENLARSLGAEAFITKPVDPEELWCEIERLMMRTRDRKRESPAATDEEAYLKEYSHIVVRKLEEKVRELEELYLTLTRVLVTTLDAKSPWTKGHSVRVAEYAVRVARTAGLDENKINRLRLSCLLHDIGKIGTYDSLLEKPTKLNAEEYDVVKRHPDKGVEIIREIPQFIDLIPAIRHHHEKYDGSGYPAGLAGESIPLPARIICIADSYDAITADRPYRPASGSSFACEELRRSAGSQFDPRFVEAFLRSGIGETHGKS